MVVEGAVRKLPPVADSIDRELLRIDRDVNWLRLLSPSQSETLWRAFADSGFREEPVLRYPEINFDPGAMRKRLLDLPMLEIESPRLEAVLIEKQRELDRQIELVRLRGSDGFLQASVALFGTVTHDLDHLARDVLSSVKPGEPQERDCGIEEFLEQAQAELAYYREQMPAFDCEIVIEEELDSMMMVSHGKFYLARGLHLPHSRIGPLVAHEIGTHVVTYFNGDQQALHQLKFGLAHYDGLQEGLGVLAEYLAGMLSADRLRNIAARVVAAQMMIDGSQVVEIFHTLREEFSIADDTAFETAVRAMRGGGLTKDIVYLEGLNDLLNYLHDGGDFTTLLMGKFALSHIPLLHELREENYVTDPVIKPSYLNDPAALARLEACRRLSVCDLYQQEGPRSQ